MRPDRIARYQALSAHGVTLMLPIVPSDTPAEGTGGIMIANTAARLHLSDLKRRVTPETVTRRRYHLESFLAHIGGSTEVRAVKKPHIEDWLYSQEVQPSTLKVRFLTIRKFFDFCQTRGWVRSLPYTGITLPRVARRQPRAFAWEQLAGQLAQVLPDRRAKLIIALACNEGLRRSELARLELGDIDFQAMTVRVVTAKSGAEDIIPLTEQTLRQITAYIAEVRGRRPGALIQSQRGGPLAPDTIGAMVSRWLREAGIKEAAFDGRSLHACRHTYAMSLVESGADIAVVQRGLRHAHATSTDHYIRPWTDVEKLRPFMGRLGKAS